ncbi:ATP-binding protein [Desulfurivibrio alkaliphilus]|uniref:histidine kinase n=1 Tax=Desulfurivibrio alkaliphilus (strain DSM 19089 / UNIQEM U267 / AHT2) TaxID=589865 RepID=D6Z029_DESAT|nr:ATP-binding protein [Desulfurivibrio alkaliphilus]ADH87062.1 multi-sensor signal transduction histidine kinase [Desulfurivibrio alkaliphilus AHT 2]
MKNILVVDNHPLIRRLLSARLEKLGYTVRTAADGLDALETLREFVPELIIVDLVMPNIDGAKLCRIVRSRPQLAGVCLVVLSAVVAEQGFELASCGADACIAKSSADRIFAHLDMVLADLAGHGRILEEHRLLGGQEVFRREISWELLSLQKHHEMVLQNIADGVLELSPNGKVIYANPRALLFFDCREEEMLGRSLPEVLEQETAEILTRALAGPPQTLCLAEPVYLPSRQVQMSLHPVEDDGQYTYVALLHDVTAARAAELALRRTSDHLRQSLAELRSAQNVLVRQEKLASIGTLASGVAHEILNPLNIIGTIVQVMQMEELPEIISEQLDEVMVQIRRATKITNSLRMFSHRGKAEIEELDIHALLDNTLELVKHSLADDHIEVEKKYTPGLPAIAADPDQLAQVLLNLINNARDAMRGRPTRRLSLTTRRVEQGVGLTVSDTGWGIAPEHLHKIFDPFFTTKDPGSGTGMGLAVVYSIVEGMGGMIEVASRPGRGTDFFMVLPLPEQGVKTRGREDERGQGENPDRRR